MYTGGLHAQSCSYRYVLCVFLPLPHILAFPFFLPLSFPRSFSILSSSPFSLLLHSSFPPSLPPSPFLPPSFPSLAGTEVSMIQQQLSNVVPLRYGPVMGEETLRGSESWKIHFMHRYLFMLVNYNALVCSELC